MKKIVIFLTLALLLTACFDSKDKKDSKSVAKVAVANSSFIEVNGKKVKFTKNIQPLPLNNIEVLNFRFSKKFMTHCSACHNDRANGIFGPTLLRQSRAEMLKTLFIYRKDKSKNIFMYELLNNMSKSDIEGIADEISRFSKLVIKAKLR